jgi:hypothetical protein
MTREVRRAIVVHVGCLEQSAQQFRPRREGKNEWLWELRMNLLDPQQEIAMQIELSPFSKALGAECFEQYRRMEDGVVL